MPKWLNKVSIIALILIQRLLDYLPCTCKIHGQYHFWVLNFHLLCDFQNFCGTFYDFWNAKGLKGHILLEVFQNKVTCKKAVSKGWCKWSNALMLTWFDSPTNIYIACNHPLLCDCSFCTTQSLVQDFCILFYKCIALDNFLYMYYIIRCLSNLLAP